MEPNYSEYSIEELEDSLKNIDQAAFPERAERLKVEIESRLPISAIKSQIVDDNFEPNDQFYRCPTCETKIGLFSKTANKWGKIKACPHCDSPFETTMNLKVFAIAVIPMFMFHLLILKPILQSFGLDQAIGVGIICGVLAVLSMRYRKVRSSNGN